MRDATYLEALQEVYRELDDIGAQLTGKNQDEHYAGLSCLFVARAVVLEILEDASEDEATQQLYNDCRWRDIAFLSSMVHDLLIHKESRCALDIASRYKSIVAILLIHFDPSQQQEIAINPRDLTEDSLNPPDGPELTEKYMKKEIGNMKIDLFKIEKQFKAGPLHLPPERREVAMELVRMREMISQFLTQIEEEVGEEDDEFGIIEDFGYALENDKEWMASIIVALIDEGDHENVGTFINRLKDFAQKIGKFFETKDINSLKGPHILFPDVEESDDVGEGEHFDVRLN